MLPLLFESLLIESSGSILLPFLESVFSQIFMRASIAVDTAEFQHF